VAARFEPARQRPSVFVGLGVVLLALVIAVEADVIGGWWFGTLGFIAIFATPQVASALGRPGAPRVRDTDVPLEWLGIDRPFSERDVREIDAALALPDAVSR
jgi:hypothetical protein